MILGFSTIFPWGGNTNFEESTLSGLKIHSIRPDEKKRWKPGRPIQMVVGNRTKQMRRFKETICEGVQDVIIVFDAGGKIESASIEGKEITDYETLAKNDGLTLSDFEKWFYNNSKAGIYKGRIIHWANLLYQ